MPAEELKGPGARTGGHLCEQVQPGPPGSGEAGRDPVPRTLHPLLVGLGGTEAGLRTANHHLVTGDACTACGPHPAVGSQGQLQVATAPAWGPPSCNQSYPWLTFHCPKVVSQPHALPGATSGPPLAFCPKSELVTASSWPSTAPQGIAVLPRLFPLPQTDRSFLPHEVCVVADEGQQASVWKHEVGLTRKTGENCGGECREGDRTSLGRSPWGEGLGAQGLA